MGKGKKARSSQRKAKRKSDEAERKANIIPVQDIEAFARSMAASSFEEKDPNEEKWKSVVQEALGSSTKSSSTRRKVEEQEVEEEVVAGTTVRVNNGGGKMQVAPEIELQAKEPPADVEVVEERSDDSKVPPAEETTTNAATKPEKILSPLASERQLETKAEEDDIATRMEEASSLARQKAEAAGIKVGNEIQFVVPSTVASEQQAEEDERRIATRMEEASSLARQKAEAAGIQVGNEIQFVVPSTNNTAKEEEAEEDSPDEPQPQQQLAVEEDDLHTEREEEDGIHHEEAKSPLARAGNQIKKVATSTVKGIGNATGLRTPVDKNHLEGDSSHADASNSNHVEEESEMDKSLNQVPNLEAEDDDAHPDEAHHSSIPKIAKSALKGLGNRMGVRHKGDSKKDDADDLEVPQSSDPAEAGVSPVEEEDSSSEESAPAIVLSSLVKESSVTDMVAEFLQEEGTLEPARGTVVEEEAGDAAGYDDDGLVELSNEMEESFLEEEGALESAPGTVEEEEADDAADHDDDGLVELSNEMEESFDDNGLVELSNEMGELTNEMEESGHTEGWDDDPDPAEGEGSPIDEEWEVKATTDAGNVEDEEAGDAADDDDGLVELSNEMEESFHAASDTEDKYGEEVKATHGVHNDGEAVELAKPNKSADEPQTDSAVDDAPDHMPEVFAKAPEPPEVAETAGEPAESSPNEDPNELSVQDMVTDFLQEEEALVEADAKEAPTEWARDAKRDDSDIDQRPTQSSEESQTESPQQGTPDNKATEDANPETMQTPDTIEQPADDLTPVDQDDPHDSSVQDMVTGFLQEEQAAQAQFAQNHQGTKPNEQTDKGLPEDSVDETPEEDVAEFSVQDKVTKFLQEEEDAQVEFSASQYKTKETAKGGAPNGSLEQNTEVDETPADGADEFSVQEKVSAFLQEEEAAEAQVSMSRRALDAQPKIDDRAINGNSNPLLAAETTVAVEADSVDKKSTLEDSPSVQDKVSEFLQEESFVDVKLKQSQHGDAIKSGHDVIKEDSISVVESLPEFNEVQLKPAPPVEKPVHGPRRASFIEAPVQLKESGHGETIKSGRDVMKDDSVMSFASESNPEFCEVQLRPAPPVEKPVHEPRRASFVEAPVQLKESGHGEAIKSGLDVIRDDTVSLASESHPEFSEVLLKQAPPVKKQVYAPRRAEFIEDSVSLKESGHGETIKNGQDVIRDETASLAESIPEFADVHLKKPKMKQASRPPVLDLVSCKPTEKRKSDPFRESCIVVQHGEGVQTVDTKVQKRTKPGFAGVKLKSSGLTDRILTETLAVKDAQKDPSKKDSLESIRAKAGKNSARAVDRPAAVESLKPAYAGFKLKSTGQADRLKAGGDVVKPSQLETGQKTPPRAASSPRSKSPPEDISSPKTIGGDTTKTSTGEPKKPAYAGFKLKSTGQAERLKAGGDVVKKEPNKPALSEDKPVAQSTVVAPLESSMPKSIKPIYAGFKLKSTGLADRLNGGSDVSKSTPARQSSLQKAVNLGKTASASPKKEGIPHVERDRKQPPAMVASGESVGSSKPAYAAFKLKSTGQAARLKAGGDVVKMEDTAKEKRPSSLKMALSEDEASTGEERRTSLRKAVNLGKKPITPQGPKVVGGAFHFEIDRQTPASGIGGDSVGPSKPAYAAFKLKRTGQADRLKAGGDVVKTDAANVTRQSSLKKAVIAAAEGAGGPSTSNDVPNKSESSSDGAGKPVFAGFKLKSTGRGGAVKDGGDVVKEVGKVVNEAAPSYSAIKLKSTGAGKIVKGGGDVQKENEETRAPPKEFEAVQLKKAAPIQKPKVESRRASYVGMQLKATGHGNVLKSGKDPTNSVDDANE